MEVRKTAEELNGGNEEVGWRMCGFETEERGLVYCGKTTL